MKRYRILIADDHAIVRDGLRHILEKDFEVVGSVEDGRTLLKEAERLNPDIVLVDISMPIVNGIEAIRQLRRSAPLIKAVVLTMHSDVTYASEVLEAGASGYVLKNAGSEEIRTAIHEVISGKKYVTPQIARDLTFTADSNRAGKPASQLTTRQREVLQLLAEGRSGKEIADLLLRVSTHGRIPQIQDNGRTRTAYDCRVDAVRHKTRPHIRGLTECQMSDVRCQTNLVY